MSGIGEALIFATGAPGSRWSWYCRLLSCAHEMDNSDASGHRVFWRHFGNYFGPSMEFGHRFHELDQLSREEFLDEIARPYPSAEPTGRRLIKSHHFAEHLPLLREWFPEARMVLFHRTDEDCLSHWLRVGGFDIEYPRYDWYEDLEKMKREIASQNAGMLSFAEEHGLEWKLYADTRELFGRLSMTRSDALVEQALRDAEIKTERGRERFVDRSYEGAPRVAVL